MVENAICFACGTEFHLLVAYMLSTTVYSPKKKMLFLLKDPRIMDYLDVVHEINLWDEIVILDPLLDYEVIDEQKVYISETSSALITTNSLGISGDFITSGPGQSWSWIPTKKSIG